ncbi:MAG TPA: pyridoxamine 5'-phosphate oxidase family protein [Polyangiaceae bacterium]|nr:pyridoxamine 5'-phosphate oxidase family protein [Polyangiaceae bacterium]
MAKPRSSGPDGAFHEGELAVQEATGERAIAERNSRMMSSTVAASPAAFLAQQRMLVVASADAAGAMWASLLFGEQGFAGSSGEHVTLDLERAQIAPEDALLQNLRAGAALGLLAIELGSRRRYRTNGFVSTLTATRVELAVREAYVNCPKYIQRRKLHESDAPPAPSAPVARGTLLDRERVARIGRADTLFVASQHPGRGADASHRGGEPGFLEVLDARTLRVPEYAGNGLYNTLGNFVVSNSAGLAIVDFDDGRVIQLTGTASVVLDPRAAGVLGGSGGPESADSNATGRYWDFSVTRWTELQLPKTLRWELLDRSPFNPPLPV